MITENISMIEYMRYLHPSNVGVRVFIHANHSHHGPGEIRGSALIFIFQSKWSRRKVSFPRVNRIESISCNLVNGFNLHTPETESLLIELPKARTAYGAQMLGTHVFVCVSIDRIRQELSRFSRKVVRRQ